MVFLANFVACLQEDLLINLVIEQMVSDTDPELGGAMQLMGIIRLLVDPENMLGTTNVSMLMIVFLLAVLLFALFYC